jgi:hypothetical protein
MSFYGAVGQSDFSGNGNMTSAESAWYCFQKVAFGIGLASDMPFAPGLT